MPDEDDEDLVAEFVSESSESLRQVETDMMLIERRGRDEEALGRIFRAVHSIKGTAGFMGFQALVDLAHEAETLMEQVRSGSLQLAGEVADALLDSTDRLSAMLRSSDMGASQDNRDLITRLRAITTPLANKAAVQEEQTEAGTEYHFSADVESLRSSAECRQGVVHGLSKVGSILDADCGIEALDSGATGKVHIHLRSPLPVGILSELFHIDPAQIEACEESAAPTPAPLPALQAVAAQESALNTRTPAPESAPEKRVTPSQRQAMTGVVQKNDTTMRVSTRFLDDLLVFTSNMVMARNQLLTRYSFNDDVSFTTMSRAITDLHKSVVKQRMQTIGELFERFQRVVRDLCRKLDREVDLFIEGGDIELDRTIIESFADPLTHMVRNAIDHAIESPQERMAQGKNRVGRLTLRAYHQSGEVIIEIEDDGRGIDAEMVTEKALAKGVIDPATAQRLSPRDRLHLIFEPGFSTKDSASDVSGRGVGMDVVRTNIESIGGAIELHTNVGQGTLFAFRLPLTQAIVSSSLIAGLVVEAGGQRFVIPETGVNEIIRLNPQDLRDRIRTVEGEHVFQLRDKVLSIVHLEDALDLPRTFIDNRGVVRPDRRARIADRRSDESSEQRSAMAARRRCDDRRHNRQTLIVLEYRRSFFGILVDNVLGVEEVVVRSLPALVDMVSTFAGHTVLGDSSVVMMVDIGGIVDRKSLQFREASATEVSVHGALKTAQQMVVFDNAPGEYFAVPLMMISFIERVQASEIKRVGSREFCQFKDSTIPILRLEDYMDVASSRSHKEYHLLLPARVAKPIGVLVGTTLSVEDFSEAFDSKIEAGFGLLGTAYRDERLIMLLDLYALFEKIMPEQFQASNRSTNMGRSARVLMVEDNHFFAKLVSSYLRQPGIELIQTFDGKEAWDYLLKEGRQVDLIVSDIEMPRMNGFELVRNIKHNPDFKDIPVIALTSLADQESRHRGMKAGFDEYAVKIDKEDLLNMVFDHLERIGIRAKQGG